MVIPAPDRDIRGQAPAGIQIICMKDYYGYVICSKRNGTLYIGVTSDLIKRVYEHKNKLVDGFSKKYDVHRLVWYESHETVEEAIVREKQIKKWNRRWKLRLIERDNPEWNDLYETVCG
jgi:putative endonuclease